MEKFQENVEFEKHLNGIFEQTKEDFGENEKPKFSFLLFLLLFILGIIPGLIYVLIIHSKKNDFTNKQKALYAQAIPNEDDLYGEFVKTSNLKNTIKWLGLKENAFLTNEWKENLLQPSPELSTNPALTISYKGFPVQHVVDRKLVSETNDGGALTLIVGGVVAAATNSWTDGLLAAAGTNAIEDNKYYINEGFKAYNLPEFFESKDEVRLDAAKFSNRRSWKTESVEFGRMYSITSDNLQQAAKIFNPKVIDNFISKPETPFIPLTFNGDKLNWKRHESVSENEYNEYADAEVLSLEKIFSQKFNSKEEMVIAVEKQIRSSLNAMIPFLELMDMLEIK